MPSNGICETLFEDEHTNSSDDHHTVLPCMNCIENIWALLKKKVYSVNHKNKDDLIAFAMSKVWKSDDDIRTACQRAICNMAQRIQECISSRGDYTYY